MCKIGTIRVQILVSPFRMVNFQVPYIENVERLNVIIGANS